MSPVKQTVLVLALAAGHVACSSSRPTPSTAPSAPRLLFQGPLTFQAEGGQVLPVPMVHAVVGGVSTRLIVDSGASHHVFTMDLVEAAHLAAQPAEAGRDHAGAAMQAFTVGTVPVKLGEADWVLEEVAAIPAIPPFRTLGIGGFISPQHLHADAYAVMDFPRGVLSVMAAEPESIANVLAAENRAMKVVQVPRATEDRKAFIGTDRVPW